jgi:hypothetical protein
MARGPCDQGVAPPCHLKSVPVADLVESSGRRLVSLCGACSPVG